jgi:hypothetical protein
VFEKDLEIPQREPLDYVQTAVKTALASIPQWWAAPAAEIFSLMFASPIERRRDEFMEDVVWVIRETAARVDGLQPEKLAQNEAFVSAMLQAARIAMSTHQRDKREYLRNALLNIALGRGLDEVKQQIFLNAIEAFSPAHVKALDVIRGRKIPWDQNSVSLPQRDYGSAIQVVVPELKGQDSLIQSVLTELRNRGFSNLSGPNSPFPQGAPATISNLGVEFLNFVLLPEASK